MTAVRLLQTMSVFCAGWRGWSCNDGSQATPDYELLLATLLLTLSNLAFLPAVVLATVRRHYTEALVYAFTACFSTVSAVFTACFSTVSAAVTACFSTVSAAVTACFSTVSVAFTVCF